MEDRRDMKILGQLKSIEQINEQRRIFLNSTINEEVSENGSNGGTIQEEDLEKDLKKLDQEKLGLEKVPEEITEKAPEETLTKEQLQ